MNHPNKILYVEFSESHSETLYAQLMISKEEVFDIHLFINDKFVFDKKYYDNFTIVRHPNNTFLERISFAYRLLKYIRKNKFDTVIINTAEGLPVRDFILIALPFKINIVGILHNAAKFKNSLTQKIISWKIKRYFVLSDFILNNIPKDTKHKFAVFYQYIPNKNKEITDKKDFIILIPGEISPKRRSYFLLLEQLKNNNTLPPDIKFELLGRVRIDEGKEVINKIKEYNLQERFILYDNYLSDDFYAQRCSNADIIMPLIFDDTENYNNYLKYQISGAYSISYSYQIPMLMDPAFIYYSEFKDTSFYCNKSDILHTIISIYKNRDLVNTKKDYFKKMSFLNYDLHKQNYLKFIDFS